MTQCSFAFFFPFHQWRIWPTNATRGSTTNAICGKTGSTEGPRWRWTATRTPICTAAPSSTTTLWTTPSGWWTWARRATLTVSSSPPGRAKDKVSWTEFLLCSDWPFCIDGRIFDRQNSHVPRLPDQLGQVDGVRLQQTSTGGRRSADGGALRPGNSHQRHPLPVARPHSMPR